MTDGKTHLEYGRNEIRKGTRSILFWATVVTVLGLFWALVAPNLLSKPGGSRIPEKARIESLRSMLDAYKLDIGSFPSAEDGLQALLTPPGDAPNWAGPYVESKSIFLDAWGHPYLYRIPSTRPGLDYDLCSGGVPKSFWGTEVVAPICNGDLAP